MSIKYIPIFMFSAATFLFSDFGVTPPPHTKLISTGDNITTGTGSSFGKKNNNQSKNESSEEGIEKKDENSTEKCQEKWVQVESKDGSDFEITNSPPADSNKSHKNCKTWNQTKGETHVKTKDGSSSFEATNSLGK